MHDGAEAREGDAVEQAGTGSLPECAQRLVDGSERRIGQAGGIEVIEASHGDLVGDADAGCDEGAQHADGHLVVGAHQGVRLCGAVQGE